MKAKDDDMELIRGSGNIFVDFRRPECRDQTAAGTLPPENNNLMSQGEKLKPAGAEQKQGNESGKNRDHAPRGLWAAVPENPQSFSTVHSFEQGYLLPGR